jgi:hypothetical protein
MADQRAAGRQGLRWDWWLFFRVLLAEAYFAISSSWILAALVFLYLFSSQSIGSWIVFSLWVLNTIPAIITYRWSSEHEDKIAYRPRKRTRTKER